MMHTKQAVFAIMNSAQLLNTDIDLLQVTLDLLKKAPRNLSDKAIADASGLKPSWISAFKCNRLSDPGFNKVRKLHNYLITVVQA
jgi:predicted transcriptional regulator